jgi:hypothetical protein
MAETQVQALIHAGITPSEFSAHAHNFLTLGIVPRLRVTKSHLLVDPREVKWIVWCPAVLPLSGVGHFLFNLDLGAPEPWHP